MWREALAGCPGNTRAPTLACTLGVQRATGADGVCFFVADYRAYPSQVRHVALRERHASRCSKRGFLVGGAASITFVTILTRDRETGREKEGERSLSVILSTMYLVLGTAILLAEIVAPWYVGWWFNGFDAEKAALCVRLTRILLPAQLFFFAGGVFGAVLLVRKQFNVQAVSPLIYNLGTIIGGLLLVKQLGVSALAIGTVAGAFFGPFFLNWIFARRAGVHYWPILDWHDEGLREWVRLSLPLKAGVSLVTADSWIISLFASKIGGAV